METITLKDVPVRVLVELIEIMRNEEKSQGLDEEIARFKSRLQTLIMFNRENEDCPQTVLHMGPQDAGSCTESGHMCYEVDPMEDILKVVAHAQRIKTALRGIDASLLLLTDAALRAKHNV